MGEPGGICCSISPSVIFSARRCWMQFATMRLCRAFVIISANFLGGFTVYLRFWSGAARIIKAMRKVGILECDPFCQTWPPKQKETPFDGFEIYILWSFDVLLYINIYIFFSFWLSWLWVEFYLHVHPIHFTSKFAAIKMSWSLCYHHATGSIVKVLERWVSSLILHLGQRSSRVPGRFRANIWGPIGALKKAKNWKENHVPCIVS